MMLRRLFATALRLTTKAAETETPSNYEMPTKLVVGLGNPGTEYVDTRHNVGYDALGLLARRYNSGRFRQKFEGSICQLSLDGDQSVALLKPTTYMNRSGRSVQMARTFYRLDPEQILVISDDFSLPLGKLRVRARGSDGGHNGLRSIAEHMRTTDYSRLRIGIGPIPDGPDPANFVLSRFHPNEQLKREGVLDEAVKAVVMWCKSGVQDCMNRFN
jgi:PTH1 family peptidyl-tRNA hydrolase